MPKKKIDCTQWLCFPIFFGTFKKKNDCFKGHAKHKDSGPVVFSPKNLAKKKKSFWVQLFILTKKFRLVCNFFPKTTFFFLFSGFTNAPHCYVSQYFFGTFKKKKMTASTECEIGLSSNTFVFGLRNSKGSQGFSNGRQ